MNKKFLLFSILFLSFIFLPSPSYAWLSGWEYRRNITINNTQIGYTLTDYQILITLDTASLISAGKMRSDCGDIRFIDTNDNLLSYWIESGCNSTNTKIWVKVPQIPASNYATIYLYYGNPTATSLSNLDDVSFIYYNSSLSFSTSSTTDTLVASYSFSSTSPFYLRVLPGFLKVRTYTSSTLYSCYQHIFINGSTWFHNWIGNINSACGTVPSDYPSLPNILPSNSTEYGLNCLRVSTTTPTLISNTKNYTSYNYNTLFSGLSGVKVQPLPFGIGNYTVVLYARQDNSAQTCYITYWEIRFFKAFNPEPTYSIGSEEESVIPEIEIYVFSPINNTVYYRTTINVTAKAISYVNTTFYFSIAFTENISSGYNFIYENESYQNNTVVHAYFYAHYNPMYIRFYAQDSFKEMEKIIYIERSNFDFIEPYYNTNVYETSEQNYTISFRINKEVFVEINGTLIYNEMQSEYEKYYSESEDEFGWIGNFSQIFYPPIVQANNTQLPFKFQLCLKHFYGTWDCYNSSNYQQNVIYAYWIDSITSDRNDYIEFEDSLIRLYVKDLFGKVNLSSSFTLIYNSSYNVSKDVNSYTTSQNFKIFNTTFDVLESFADNETRSYFATLTVSYQGNSRIMNSPIQEFKVYKIILTNCSIYPTKALTFYVKDEETDQPIQNATIEVTFDVWKTGEIKRNYAWKFYLENRDNQSICIYPSWAEYTIDSTIQYYKPGYKDRAYYIYTKINNSTTGTNLYLLSESLGDIIVIYVKDENGNKVQNAIVKIQRYYVGSNSYKTVAQVKTDYEGKGVTFLRVNEIYYRFIIEKNFVVLRETEPTIITCTAGGCPPYPVTLSVTEQKPAKYFQYLGKIAYACTLNEETNILRCTVDDTSQLMQKARLLVEQKGALKFDVLCDNICESSACTLTCDLGNRTNKVYRYQLLAYFSEPPVILEQNILDYMTGIIFWGSQGLLIGFILTSTLFFVGIWNPVVAIVFAFLGIVAGFLLGIIPLSISSLVGLALAIGILIYKMRS